LIFLFCFKTIIAQTYKADRPQAAFSSEIVPLKTFAVETGFSVRLNNAHNYAFNYNETNIRIGMMKLMEMTVGFKVPGTLATSTHPNQHAIGIASPKLGLKVLMKKKEEGVKMGIAFIFDGSINFGTNNFKDAKILPSFRVAADVDFNEKTNLLLNYGAAWLENRLVIDPEGNPVIDPFIVLAGSLSHRFTDQHVLFFGINATIKYNNFRSDYFATGGYIFKLKDNMQIDISASAGLSPNSPRGIINIGFAGCWPKRNLNVPLE